MDLDERWRLRREASLRRKELRERIVAYLGGKCQICGYDSVLEALEAHHEDSRSKDFSISDRLGCSWEKLEPELRKCFLLCCRCHREVHVGLHPHFIVLEDSELGYDPEDDASEAKDHSPSCLPQDPDEAEQG